MREDMPVLQGDATAMLLLVDGVTDLLHLRAQETGSAPVVDGHLVTTGASGIDLADIKAFDAVFGSLTDKSCAA